MLGGMLQIVCESYKYHDNSIQAFRNSRRRVWCSPILVLLWYALVYTKKTIKPLALLQTTALRSWR